MQIRTQFEQDGSKFESVCAEINFERNRLTCFKDSIVLLLMG